MREIRFPSGFPAPADEWMAVGYIKKIKMPCKIGNKAVYIPDQFKILEGTCEGDEVSPLSPQIEIRKRLEKT